jgi:hypothetical protein
MRPMQDADPCRPRCDDASASPAGCGAGSAPRRADARRQLCYNWPGSRGTLELNLERNGAYANDRIFDGYIWREPAADEWER